MLDPFFSPPPPITALAQPIADRFDLKTLPLHLHEVILGYLLYQTIQSLSPTISSRLFPDVYPKLPRRTKVNWDIHLVSFVQSCIMSCLALYTVFFDEERTKMDWAERVWGYTGMTGMCQGFAAGYFVWDLKISVQNLKILGWGSLMHALSSCVVSCIGFRPFLNYYGISFVLYEISTPMLNIHWFLDKLNMTGSKLQLYNGILLLLSFFFARVVWGNYMSYWVYNDILQAMRAKHIPSHHRFRLPIPSEEDVQVMRYAGDMTVPRWMACTYIFSNTVLSLLNVFWFWKMVDAVRKRFDPKVAAAASKEDAGKVANGFGGYEGTDEVDDALKKEN